jgi:hypothetical protein
MRPSALASTISIRSTADWKCGHSLYMVRRSGPSPRATARSSAVLDAEPRAQHEPRLRPRETATEWRAGQPRWLPPPRRAGRLPMFISPISASGVEAWK